jgi:hypothetical protein
MVKQLRDLDIRGKLHRSKEFLAQKSKDPDTIIIDEFGICEGAARVDVAIINGSINAYEIKSSADTLARLESQISEYGKVFDSATLVVSEKHFKKSKKILPSWWGIKKVVGDKCDFEIIDDRMPEINQGQDPFAIAQLLWKEEALSILKEKGLAKGYKSKPRKEIWKKLANTLSLEELKYYVRRTLKARVLKSNWRVDVQQK